MSAPRDPAAATSPPADTAPPEPVVAPASAAPELPAPQEPAEPSAAGGGASVARRSRAVPLLAAALALAVAVAATLGVLLRRQAVEERAAAEALGTARSFAVTVTSYDYRELDQDFATVLDGATGEFKDQYSGASRTLRQLITDARATAKGTVLDAAVRSASTDEVVVLVFVDQEITNAVTPQPRLDRNRVVMTLTPHDGRWLVE